MGLIYDRFRDSVFKSTSLSVKFTMGLKLMPNESFHDQTKIFTYQGCQDYENSKKRLSIYFYRAAVFFEDAVARRGGARALA
jgi:hypothetical protein